MDEFLKILHSECNGEHIHDAYSRAEVIYKKLHGKRKFKNYNTFRASLTRFKKKKFNKPVNQV